MYLMGELEMDYIAVTSQTLLQSSVDGLQNQGVCVAVSA